MSWLARSLVSSLRPDHGASDGDDDDKTPARRNDDRSHRAEEQDEGEEQQPGTPTRGVKEDLSELTQTLTRQFWGVASFLAPPPNQIPSSPPHPDSSPSDDGRPSGASVDAAAAESPRFAGIRTDFAEIGGRFRSGISMLSSNMAVSEISKIASTFFGSEEADEDGEEGEEEEEENAGVVAVGVTDEVLAFVRNVSMHPETWLDFPLLDDEDSDDFYMFDAQQEHALAVERLAPILAALRIELCPSHMTEGCFWKIYFVLLHPRLNKHDAELLSTPQIVQARAMLLQDLQNRTRLNSERSGRDVSEREEVASPVLPGENVSSPPNIRDGTTPPKAHILGESTASVPSPEYETDKHPIQSTEVKIIEKGVIEEDPAVQVKSKDIPSDALKVSTQRYEEDGDEWLEEETGETGVTRGAAVPLGNEEDVSFSDLEADDDDVEGMHMSSKTKTRSIGSATKEESGWVQLNKSSEGAARNGDSSSPQTRESNDWLDVDIDAV